MPRRRPQLVLTAALVAGLFAGPSAATAVQPTPGSSTAGDSYYPAMGNGGYDALHYSVDLVWRPATGRIRASTTIRSAATQDLSSFNLELFGLDVHRVLVGGVPARFRRDRAELHIVPSQSVMSGGRFTTVVEYDGAPREVQSKDHARTGWISTSDGATVLSEPTGAMTWFPVNNTPQDKASFDISVNVPSGLEAASNGLLVGRDTGDQRTTWHWRERDPMAAYLATVSIGNYDMFRTTSPDGLPLISFVDEDLGQGVTARRNLPEVVTFLESKFGPYPFDSAGLIADKVGAGYALETQNRPVYPGVPSTLLQVHEMAHQWFGNSVTLRDWSDIWLAEGFATYAEWLWEAKTSGHPSVPQRHFDDLYQTHDADSGFWQISPGDPGAEQMFETPVYQRGAMTLQALRRAVGGADFFEILRTWADTHAYASGTTAAFVALSEQISGEQLDRLFDSWLYTPRKPTRY